MNRKLKKFLETEFQSKAQVLDRRMVEVVAPDGEIFHINSTIGAYDSEDTQRYYLCPVKMYGSMAAGGTGSTVLPVSSIFSV